MIEYFGLAGDEKYDIKTKKKIELLREHKIELIEIYPRDLVNKNRLAELIGGLRSIPGVGF